MGLCEAVADLAVAVANARAPLTAREAYLLYVLRGMPRFRDVARLELWELAYKEVAPPFVGGTQTERLIDAVFELGRNNLYGVYNVPNTAEYYRKISATLAAAGVPLPPAREIRDW